MCVSGLLLTRSSADHPRVALLFAAYVLFGIGFGLVNAPITNTAVSGMPRAQAGVAAAVASTSRQVGPSLGVAVIGAGWRSRRCVGPLATASPPPATPAWWIIAGCGARGAAGRRAHHRRWAPAHRRTHRRAAADRRRQGAGDRVMAEVPDQRAELAEQAWRGLRLLLLERNDRRKQVGDALGMSYNRVKALRRIAAEPLTLRKLAEFLVIDAPYATVIVDDLVRRGLAERTTHPGDRRCKVVRPTPEGRVAAGEGVPDHGHPAGGPAGARLGRPERAERHRGETAGLNRGPAGAAGCPGAPGGGPVSSRAGGWPGSPRPGRGRRAPASWCRARAR